MATKLGRFDATEQVAIETSHLNLVLNWAARSEVGVVRAHNEDSFVADYPIFAVADGMGGHAAGDQASKHVVNELAELIGQPHTTPQGIYQCLQRATVKIDQIESSSALGAAGTTVTGVALVLEQHKPYWFIFNIGDSRVYRLVDGQFSQLTVDHSVVQELVDSGLITPEEAHNHPDSNMITRAIGFQADPIPDGWLVPVIDGERFLVCSDGLTKEFTDDELAQGMARKCDAQELADSLVFEAIERGGRDNVSVIVLDVSVQNSKQKPTNSIEIAEAPRIEEPDEAETTPGAKSV